MKPLRLAVIGTGHLGRIHARLASEAPSIDLAAIVEVNPEGTPARGRRSRCARPAADLQEVVGDIEAAIVATPTVHHHQVVKQLLDAGVHVLVEKPITLDVAEADDLVATAERQGLVLQVGHVERFNPGLEAVVDQLNDVRYLQATRASGFTFRSTDIGVVMDLMIHDIDVALSLAQSPVAQVTAFGVSVMGGHEDIAQAQIQFENGCLAQLTASRVNYEPARSMQVFTPQGFTTVDFANRKATTIRPTEQLLQRQLDVDSLDADATAHFRDHLFEELLVKSEIEPPESNAIAEEHRDFAESIREQRAPRVSGEAGRNALVVAEQVLASIASHSWDNNPMGRQGAMMTAPIPLRRAG